MEATKSIAPKSSEGRKAYIKGPLRLSIEDIHNIEHAPSMSTPSDPGKSQQAMLLLHIV
jgi:hypothetical protein